jgi:DDE superfamily endonuclease
LICDENRRISFLSVSKSGRRHDKRLLDKSGVMPNTPPHTVVWGDSGFQGIDEQHPNTITPATKKHPLTTEEKQNNSVISGIRAVVEHAISGMKRLACMSHVYRNRKVSVDDSFALLSAGMWNFHLQTA